MAQTFSELLAPHPDSAPAIGAPGRAWLSYGGLRTLSTDVRAALRAAGVGPKDRVAIVLPNGPEMATAFATIAQAATTAPLNPAYKEDEFAFYLEDLGARAIVLAADEDGPALRAARRFGLIVLRVAVPDGAAAGAFDLMAENPGAPVSDGTPDADDVALVLHTSGTTSRPKIVPLLQSNVVASARNVADSLALSDRDRCLNV
ncbi:AMP-binding protein, partial [Citreimonas sp.]|uniref:AMP-binding protein n=1 Tax=Citreimonas sp. TaxID=3036715 RepID=UPI0035C84290